MADVKWIKLDKDIFNNRKIKQIEKMPDGDALIVIWLKILTLAGDVNDGGLVYFTKDIPYTDQLLATEFDRPLNTIKLALTTFEKFGMIEIVDDLILVSNWEEYQNTDGLEKIKEQNRIRQARFREKKKALLIGSVTDSVTVTEDNAIDIDKERDKEKDIKDNKRFVPPTVEEVRSYCKERGNQVDAERFIDYYSSQKWKKANGRPVADWKACVRQWEKSQYQRVGKNGIRLSNDRDNTLDEIL